jgi:hypothetical protein
MRMDHQHQKAMTWNHTLTTKVLNLACFLLLENYLNNASFNFALDLITNSKDLHFRVLFWRKHNIDTQAQMHKLCNTQQHEQDTTKHETKAQQTIDNLEP